MRTIFKKGMEVYDQFYFPNKKGVIKVISNDEKELYPVGVSFENEACLYYYTLEGQFRKERIPTLSTKLYKIELKGFEQKAPAPTFEEAWEEAEKIYEPKSEYNKEEYGGYPTQELADASEALRRLLFLRDYYNEGWQPDLKNKEQRGISVILDSEGIFFVWGVLKETETYALVFKDEEVAERFIEEQRELLEIAKPLL